MVLRAARHDEQGSAISQAVLASFASAVGSEQLQQGKLPASLEERDLPVAEDRYDAVVREAGRTGGSGQMAVPREETGTLAPLRALLEKQTTGVPELISPNDTMFSSNPNSSYYFSTGQSALRCIKLAMLGVDTGEPSRILDLPSGHGRILRALRAAFPQAELTAGDINRDGVDFCAQALGASLTFRPAACWCSQLMDDSLWNGCGRARSTMASVRTSSPRWSPSSTRVTVSANRDYPSYPGFGFSLTGPGWVCTRLWKLPGLQLVSFTERGWNQHQDVVAVRLRP